MAFKRIVSLETQAVRASRAFQNAQDLMASASDQLVKVRDGLESEARAKHDLAESLLAESKRILAAKSTLTLNHAPEEIRGLFANIQGEK